MAIKWPSYSQSINKGTKQKEAHNKELTKWENQHKNQNNRDEKGEERDGEE